MNMERWLDYVSAMEPGYVERIQGATDTEIARLDTLTFALCQKRLPSDYVAFLRHLGHGDGGLRPRAEGSPTDIDDIIELLEDYQRDGDGQGWFAPNCILIGYMGVATFDLSLEVTAGGAGRVFYSTGSEIKFMAAETLEKFLYQHAFSRFRLQRLPVIHAFARRDETVTILALRHRAEDIGLVCEWFSDTHHVIASRGGLIASFSSYQTFGWHIDIRFGGDDSTAITRLQDAFADLLKM